LYSGVFHIEFFIGIDDFIARLSRQCGFVETTENEFEVARISVDIPYGAIKFRGG
jgi:hypothetical protein